MRLAGRRAWLFLSVEALEPLAGRDIRMFRGKLHCR